MKTLILILVLILTMPFLADASSSTASSRAVANNGGSASANSEASASKGGEAIANSNAEASNNGVAEANSIADASDDTTAIANSNAEALTGGGAVSESVTVTDTSNANSNVVISNSEAIANSPDSTISSVTINGLNSRDATINKIVPKSTTTKYSYYEDEYTEMPVQDTTETPAAVSNIAKVSNTPVIIRSVSIEGDDALSKIMSDIPVSDVLVSTTPSGMKIIKSSKASTSSGEKMDSEIVILEPQKESASILQIIFDFILG